MWLTSVAIKRPVFIVMVFLAIAVIGIRSLSLMKVDLFPDIDIPYVTVSTVYPGATPEEIETLITKPLEDELISINKVDNIISTSRQGVSIILIKFLLEADIDVAAADVRDKVAIVKPNLPEDADDPKVLKLDIGATPVIYVGVRSSKIAPRELRTLVKDNIKDRLHKLSGVGAIDLTGGEIREILVNVDEKALEAYKLSLMDIKALLAAANLNIPAGNIKQGRSDYTVRLIGEFKDPEEIQNLVIAKKIGDNREIIPFSDIATVEDAKADREDYTRVNGADSVGLIIRKQPDANTLKVVRLVKKELHKLTSELPSGIELIPTQDQSTFITSTLDEGKRHLVLGALWAMIIVFLFLHNIRGTFIIGLAIPTSLIATFIPLFFTGQTVNIMTLMGLTLSIGALVDDSIVVLENIYRHLSLGEPPREAALNGRSEIGLAAIAISLVDVAVFLPIAFMGGIVGRIFRAFGLTIAFAVLFSLFVSFTLTPMLASRWFSAREVSENRKGFWRKVFKKVDEFLYFLDDNYKKIIALALKNRAKVVLLSFFLLVFIIIFIAPKLGIEFMPETDRGRISINIELPPGARLEETNKVAMQIEKILLDRHRYPEIKDVFSQIGAQSGSILSAGDTGPQYGTIDVELINKEERKLSDKQVQQKIIKDTAFIPGAKLTIVTLSRGVGGAEKPLQIEITGDNLADILDTAEKVKNIVKNTPGATNVETSWKPGVPELQVRIDREKAEKLGITALEIGGILRMAIAGNTDLKYREKGDEYDIRIRLKEEYRSNPEKLSNLFLGYVNKVPFYLKDVAQVNLASAPTKLERKDRRKIVYVQSDISWGHHLGNVQREIQKELKKLNLPPGVNISYGGDVEMMQEAFTNLIIALVIAVVLVYILMAALFESYINPFVIMFSLPMALVGALLSLFITGKTLSIMSMIGIIMLMGLVDKNAILLIDFTTALRGRGLPRNEAVQEAGRIRLRPILMTTFAMIFAMMPTALGIGSGSEMRAPMAIAVIGGLLLSTLLTLVVIPVVYTLIDDLHIRIKQVFVREKI